MDTMNRNRPGASRAVTKLMRQHTDRDITAPAPEGKIPISALPFMLGRLAAAIARSDHATYKRLLPTVRALLLERDEARR